MVPETDGEIVAMVRKGGGVAFTALARVIRDKRDYPGDVDDVFALLDDGKPISFGSSPSDLAQAYLIHKGFIRRPEVSPRWQVRGLLDYYDDPSEPVSA